MFEAGKSLYFVEMSLVNLTAEILENDSTERLSQSQRLICTLPSLFTVVCEGTCIKKCGLVC